MWYPTGGAMARTHTQWVCLRSFLLSRGACPDNLPAKREGVLWILKCSSTRGLRRDRRGVLDRMAGGDDFPDHLGARKGLWEKRRFRSRTDPAPDHLLSDPGVRQRDVYTAACRLNTRLTTNSTRPSGIAPDGFAISMRKGLESEAAARYSYEMSFLNAVRCAHAPATV